MHGRPFLDQANRGPGLDSTGQWVSVEGEGGLLPLVLRVEVWQSVLAVEHPDHDAEENRDDRHVPILLSPAPPPNVQVQPRPWRPKGGRARLEPVVSSHSGHKSSASMISEMGPQYQ